MAHRSNSHIILIYIALIAIHQLRAQEPKGTQFKKRFLRYSSHCAQQHSTTLVDIMGLLAGEETSSSSGKCYILCMLAQYKIINRDGGYRRETFKEFLNSMPESRFKKSLEASSQDCYKQDNQEECEKAYRFARCFYTSAISSKKYP
uniref:Odorant-binding protein 4 n=1 Tax=Riptortus pedestris TaxID=329032 RepID=A0A2Z4HQ32_RIPPE|nr:odorant-binding protein 4 [Riptortus pedestris]